MTRAEFWKLIESTKRSDPAEHEERLVKKLAKLDPKEILSFAKCWQFFHGKAYSWKLWGAAYLINGGCSDDGFVYFRDWLLLKGEQVYTAALKDPDSLSKVRVEPDEAEWECYPAADAYCQALGVKDHEVFFEAFAKTIGDHYGPASDDPDVHPTGKSWDFEDDAKMKKRYPKLFKKFCSE